MQTPTPTEVPAVTPAQEEVANKFRRLAASLNGQFRERRVEVKALITALVAGENGLLLGPPGTGKSAITRALCTALQGSEYFENLMGRTSKPEELFGPYDITGLKQGRYERCVEGYLPTADVAFLDEIFKCNSAVLNLLLTILNERKFKQGRQVVDAPLKIVIGASNELPDENATDSLDALYDRFLVRCWVDDLKSEDNFLAVIGMADEPAIAVRITADELTSIRDMARNVLIPTDVLQAVAELRRALAVIGIEASTRRWRKCMKLVRAVAAINGRAVAEREDLLILADSLWRTPDERAMVLGQVTQVVSPALAEAMKVLDAANEAYQTANVDGFREAKSGGSGAAWIATAGKVNSSLSSMADKVRAMDGGASVDLIAEKIEALQAAVQKACMDYYRR